MYMIHWILEMLPQINKGLLRHLELVGLSLLFAIIITIPLAVFLSRNRSIARYVLALAGVIQTIPGLVMLGLFLIFFGIGKWPAVAVLTLYAILPLLQNTYTGLTEVNSAYIEAAKGIGMSNGQRLFKVEFPLAIPSIIGGLRISTIYIISWATLAALNGAGGLGDLIWTGLSTYKSQYILAGAIPSALLAITASWLIGGMQRLLTPKGLRG
ncbi:MAG: ABC transporter permease [Anaerovoracaceae bacterium]|jgi:osmoprotectant transport system permease protein